MEHVKKENKSPRIMTENWAGGKWTKLGPKSDAITVKLIEKWFRV